MYYELNENTGELVPTEKNLVELRPGDYVRRKEQVSYCAERKGEVKSFVWLIFSYGEELFPNISPANLTRLIYAATFVDTKGKIMQKERLQKRMKLNKPRWKEFWDEMVENDILYEEDGVVYVNKKYISKGSIDTDQNYTRLFCEYVRQLYESCRSTSDHKQLSYIFKIIPFVNRRTNIVCRNQDEQDDSSVVSMRLGEFCDAIGYDKSNARRLARDLLKVRIDDELAVGFFVSDLDEKNWIIVANPKLYFGGKYDEMFMKYRQLFYCESREYKLIDNKKE